MCSVTPVSSCSFSRSRARFSCWRTQRDAGCRFPTFINPASALSPALACSTTDGTHVCAASCSWWFPKAAKADIWRLAIVLRYGGIYVDSDVNPVHPFREMVWPNASAASGIGGGRDLHQWCSPALSCHCRAATCVLLVTACTPCCRVGASASACMKRPLMVVALCFIHACPTATSRPGDAIGTMGFVQLCAALRL